MKVLVVFAMKEEAQDQFNDLDVLYTGIGKVNASYHLAKRIHVDRPDIVINLGTAGSQKHKGGTIVNPTTFIQRDMDVTALGFELFQTPFSDDPVRLECGRVFEKVVQGSCGSGDSFDTSERAAQFDVVDMEAYALALICRREDIPFLCLKYVSDGADDNADQDWAESLKHASRALRFSLDEFLKDDTLLL